MDLKEYFFFEKRKDKNFSVKKFAEMLGIAPNTLYKISNGRHRPGFKTALKIEELTGRKVSGLEVMTYAMERYKEKMDFQKQQEK